MNLYDLIISLKPIKQVSFGVIKGHRKRCPCCFLTIFHKGMLIQVYADGSKKAFGVDGSPSSNVDYSIPTECFNQHNILNGEFATLVLERKGKR